MGREDPQDEDGADIMTIARVFRWMVRLISAALILIVGALWLVYYFASRSLPDYDDHRAIAGIGAPVEIVRDTADVPFIFAKSDADAFFALGYVHAQDRLWQMVVARRTVQGRLSEVFGTRTLKSDELMRRLDLYRRAQASVAVQTPEARAALDAYAKGVNAWINVVSTEAKGRGAPEFFVYPGEIALWQPADSIALLKLLAFQESDQMQTEVARARLSLLNPDWPTVSARFAEVLETVLAA